MRQSSRPTTNVAQKLARREARAQFDAAPELQEHAVSQRFPGGHANQPFYETTLPPTTGNDPHTDNCCVQRLAERPPVHGPTDLPTYRQIDGQMRPVPRGEEKQVRT